MVISKDKHMLTVWTLDMLKDKWAWSCKCGNRYKKLLRTQDEARAEARAHKSAADRGVAVGAEG